MKLLSYRPFDEGKRAFPFANPAVWLKKFSFLRLANDPPLNPNFIGLSLSLSWILPPHPNSLVKEGQTLHNILCKALNHRKLTPNFSLEEAKKEAFLSKCNSERIELRVACHSLDDCIFPHSLESFYKRKMEHYLSTYVVLEPELMLESSRWNVFKSEKKKSRFLSNFRNRQPVIFLLEVHLLSKSDQ